ncbi:MAG TPA: HAD-IC family P-type ATPase [Candidatus Limnocylindria bacterium]|jgi:Ca2+-transporting ATPase
MLRDDEGERVPAAVPPYASPGREVAAGLEVDPDVGLSSAEAAVRHAELGANELGAVPPPSVWRALREAITEPFVLMLIGAAVLAIVIGEVRDGLLILVGVIPIVAADVATTYRAERALEVLRQANAPHARVRRDGEPLLVLAREVVPGDVVLLATGDVVPADVRIVTARALLVDRSVLTGESLPERASEAPDAVDVALAERHSMAYSGTSVVGGHGEGIVVAIGVDTEVGLIAGSLGGDVRPRSPLEVELARLVRILLVVAVALVVVTVGLGLVRGNPIGETLLAGVAAAIAAIPEEPPILLAVILGLGAYRLLRRDVLVRRLNAQETLGAIDLILTDKTGTLTANRLRVVSVETPDGELAGTARAAALGEALRAEAEAWDRVRVGRSGAFAQAIHAELTALGTVPELAPEMLLEAEPPSDDRPFARTRCLDEQGPRELALGAPEAVLGLVRDGGGSAAAPDEPLGWEAVVSHRAERGGRLLLLARRADGDRWRPVAAIVFADPLRPEIHDALGLAARAGIQVVMVSGDHPRTALAIAREAGLPDGTLLTGAELQDMDDARLHDELGELRIVARATPADKLRLVRAAAAAGRTVAVTGDGVNDAPALHHADVAVAMGSGTAVAREAADLVLGDDSFGTLMQALREGRRMIANAQKGLVFLLTTHVALLGYILVATLAGFSTPLLPIQILWMEFFIDISASIAFEREAEEPDSMTRPPRRRGVPLLETPILVGVVLAGGFTGVAALALVMGIGGEAEHAAWMAFTTLVVAQVVRANANRTLRTSLLRIGPNPVLLGLGVCWVAVQAAIPHIPPLADAFEAVPLTGTEWLLVAAIALAPAIVAEGIRRTGRTWVA